jgi:hypothetical protein
VKSLYTEGILFVPITGKQNARREQKGSQVKYLYAEGILCVPILTGRQHFVNSNTCQGFYAIQASGESFTVAMQRLARALALATDLA